MAKNLRVGIVGKRGASAAAGPRSVPGVEVTDSCVVVVSHDNA